ncbi:GCN5-related N-acetyltransferase [Gemmatirosa kalamazoonensis]|uniref:GCN5-related N-acetyltransferase n=1 Tax=Gemmatirosa kalamazoonensis TaxID=861299 RepID=W0RQW8_9BACT|nr:GNAT family N-acetyltransferase [Gemmatirosa kalamazoonensis]AHG91968.1 GCN5-related N-acetyltransferase [Gemmatirosa kalamazoonensis]
MSAGAPREVVRTYLEMRDPAAHRDEAWTAIDVRLARLDPCPPDTYRALYGMVGARWAWRDRDAWSDARLAEYLARPDVAVWAVVDAGGAPGGYFELARHDDGSVEIAYFGLAERLFGRRLGAQLLSAAVREAWAMGAARVWLHTCTLDSPAALPNYLARGFTPFRTETYAATAPAAASLAP